MHDEPERYMHNRAAVLRYPSPVQAVRPTRHWWRCPRLLAGFRGLMVVSRVKPPASAGPLSRLGDYLLAARGPGLFLRSQRPPTFPHDRAITRGPLTRCFIGEACADNGGQSPTDLGSFLPWQMTPERRAERSRPVAVRCPSVAFQTQEPGEPEAANTSECRSA